MVDPSVTLCRLILSDIIKEVQAVVPGIDVKKAWVYKLDEDHWEFHFDEFYWDGSADNAYDARGNGWSAYLEKLRGKNTEGTGDAN